MNPLFWTDLKAAVIGIMYLAVHGLTAFYMSLTAKMTQTSINSAITLLEANPLAGLVMKLGHVSFILQYVFIPALCGGAYLLLRGRVKQQKMPLEMLQFVANTWLFIFFVNFINDLAMVLGRMAA